VTCNSNNDNNNSSMVSQKTGTSIEKRKVLLLGL
jgi:hypothetical protein